MDARVAPALPCRRFGVALLVAAAAVAGLASVTPGQSAGQTLRDAADPQGRYTISVPADWDVRTVPYQGDIMLAALGPADADGIRPTLTVYVVPQRQSMSSEGVAKSAEAELQRLPDYAPVGQGPTTVDGLPAYYRDFTRTRAGRSFYQMQVYVARGLSVYVISCSILNNPELIERDSPLIRKITRTLRISAQHAAPQPSGTPG
jgi:hypothetical protein